jgi:hypothetical protein
MQVLTETLIEFSKEDNEHINILVQDFVDKMGCSASYYQAKRGAKHEKAVADIFLGKKAEFVVAKYLNEFHNFPLLEPDLEIRKGRQKGWLCDLPYNDHFSNLPNVHVKACSKSTYRYCGDYSWTFQFKDNNAKSGKDELFKNEFNNEVIAFVYMDDTKCNVATVKAIIPWSETCKFLKPPLKKTLVGIKLCLYYQDLVNLNKVA